MISNKKEDNKKSRDLGVLMKVIAPFTALGNATSDMWRMLFFNYQLPKKVEEEYWNQKIILHLTNSHFKIYCD